MSKLVVEVDICNMQRSLELDSSHIPNSNELPSNNYHSRMIPETGID